MVMIGRFSSDDPGWREPWERDAAAAKDDADWPDLDPRPRRQAQREPRDRNRKDAKPSQKEQQPGDLS